MGWGYWWWGVGIEQIGLVALGWLPRVKASSFLLELNG